MNFTRDSALIVGTACILLAGLGIFTLFSTLSAPPHGDEPHYLLMTVSLIRDGDLNLADNYARRDARAFMKEPLMPHWGLRENGKLYSSHDPGLAVLLAPAFAAAGRPGASLCMAVLGLMALCVTMGLARRLGIPARSTALGVLMAGLTVPYLMMSGAAFPEIPAALGLMAAVMLLFRGNCGRHFLTGGLCLGLIPWFHLKYAAISVLVFLMFPLWQRPRFRSAVMTAIPAAISAAGLLLFQRYLYGDPFYLLRIKSGGFQWPFTGMAGLMLDREVGLLVFAPVLIPGLMGLLFRWRRPREMNALAVVFIIFWILSGSWTDWHSGHCPPSRYLVPFIPALGLFTAWELHRVRDRSGRGLFALLWGASLAQVAGVFLTIPENAIVHYDGINRLWTRFLPWNLEYLAPSLLNPRPGTGLQAAAWLLLVTAAGLVVLGRTPRSRVCALILLLAAVIPAGYGVTTEAAYRAELARTPLPHTPVRLLEPAPDRVFSGELPGLIWEPVPGADGYIWVIEFPGGERWEVPRYGRTRVDIPRSLAEAVPPGRYCWRIIPVKGGHRGVPSEKRCFELLDQRSQ